MEYFVQLIGKNGNNQEYYIKEGDFIKQRNKILNLRQDGKLEGFTGFKVFKRTFEEEVKFGDS